MYVDGYCQGLLKFELRRKQQRTIHRYLFVIQKYPVTILILDLFLQKPTYDILHRPHNVYILMNLMKPPPHIQFDAASRLCTVTGEIKEPPIVRQEGSTMPVRRRYYGEFELKIELNKLLPHEVALVYNGCYEDNESWFFYIEFDKIKPVSEGGKVSEKLLKS